jgi:hypothetical protein
MPQLALAGHIWSGIFKEKKNAPAVQGNGLQAERERGGER